MNFFGSNTTMLGLHQLVHAKFLDYSERKTNLWVWNREAIYSPLLNFNILIVLVFESCFLGKFNANFHGVQGLHLFLSSSGVANFANTWKFALYHKNISYRCGKVWERTCTSNFLRFKCPIWLLILIEHFFKWCAIRCGSKTGCPKTCV